MASTCKRWWNRELSMTAMPVFIGSMGLAYGWICLMSVIVANGAALAVYLAITASGMALGYPMFKRCFGAKTWDMAMAGLVDNRRIKVSAATAMLWPFATLAVAALMLGWLMLALVVISLVVAIIQYGWWLIALAVGLYFGWRRSRPNCNE